MKGLQCQQYDFDAELTVNPSILKQNLLLFFPSQQLLTTPSTFENFKQRDMTRKTNN